MAVIRTPVLFVENDMGKKLLFNTYLTHQMQQPISKLRIMIFLKFSTITFFSDKKKQWKKIHIKQTRLVRRGQKKS